MKLTPIDQLPAIIKKKRTPVLLYGRDKWLEGRFLVGTWCEDEWQDTTEGRTIYDVTHFALLPNEPEVTAEERAAFEALCLQRARMTATKICLDLDTGKLTLPKGLWEIVVTGGGSATVNIMTVNNEPESISIRDLLQMDEQLQAYEAYREESKRLWERDRYIQFTDAPPPQAPEASPRVD